ncbi:hypothetical protein LS684_19050 [Cytobacillus spongiae]|uniref:hypothetical protein n=1 Tax=Cytobacillus spongiae TaxID=2901381 RepID=UPI001F27BC34|nr:hypothetical protein [Cytobacillus spongiae]UII55698.1 hypothetical protein LS684_19050 [Cytobacillus spongiae]
MKQYASEKELIFIGDLNRMELVDKPTFYDALQLLKANPSTQLHRLPLRDQTNIHITFLQNTEDIHITYDSQQKQQFILKEKHEPQSVWKSLSYFLIKEEQKVLFLLEVPDIRKHNQTKDQPKQLAHQMQG